MRTWLLGCIAGALAAVTAVPPASAQEYPARPVTLVVPIGAGGPLDLTARQLGAKLSESLGRPFVIENRPGGSTIVGASAVAKSDADGYTLLVAPNSTVTTNVTIFRKLPYDPLKDFIPVALLAQVPFVLVGGPGLTVKQVPDLIAEAKRQPGKLTYGSTGIGTTPHLAGEMLKSNAGIDMTHVAYRGMPAALADVIAGQVNMTFADPANTKPMLEAGKLHAFGVTSKEPVSSLPGVAPLADSGLPGFEAVAWNMVLVPANTPPAVVEKLHAAIKAAMAQPDIQERMKTLGLVAHPSPSLADLKSFLATEIARWGDAVRSAGIAGSE